VYAVSRAAHGKMSISGIPSRPNYCEIIVAYTKFSNVATTQPGRSQVGNPWCK